MTSSARSSPVSKPGRKESVKNSLALTTNAGPPAASTPIDVRNSTACVMSRLLETCPFLRASRSFLGVAFSVFCSDTKPSSLYRACARKVVHRSQKPPQSVIYIAYHLPEQIAGAAEDESNRGD